MTVRKAQAGVVAAMLGAAAVMAHQVAGKTTREAQFFSNFHATALLPMTILTALFSLGVVLVWGRALRAAGPARMVPRIFWASGLLHLVEWVSVSRFPRAVAVGFYFHFALGAALISAFWLLMSERFDPHTAKRQMGRIVGAGLAGALFGGVLAFRFAPVSIPVLPLLAVLHGICGCVLLPRGAAASAALQLETGFAVGLRPLARIPYLRDLMALVFLCATSAMMIDFVFKAQAQQAAASGQVALQRFYALFYTAATVLSIVVQAGATGRLLAKAGLAATAGTLPATVALGGLGAAIWPGLAGFSVARGSECVVRNSIFKSAYELFYSPVLPDEKRMAKPVIDVGADRMGDIAGSATMQSLLWLSHGGAQRAGLIIAAASGLLALWISRRLTRGYVCTLENSLRARAIELDVSEVKDKTTRSVVMRTSTTLGRQPAAAAPDRAARAPGDPLLRRIAELRSGDPGRVRQAVRQGALTPALIAHVIPLLAWDNVAEDAARALNAAAGSAAGQLIDALLDPEQEFAVRRRIPRLLAAAPPARAVEGLVLGLDDARFEVRYRCGKALRAIVQREPQTPLPGDRVLAAVLKEIQVDRKLWETHRLLDGCEEGEMLAELAGSGLEHVFTLLSVVFPNQPIRIAFRALQTDDQMLRGTALEYLAGVLPAPIQDRLWPLLDQPPAAPTGRLPNEEVLEALLRSHESVELRLADMKAKRMHAQ